jgi:hypothetical protein
VQRASVSSHVVGRTQRVSSQMRPAGQPGQSALQRLSLSSQTTMQRSPTQLRPFGQVGHAALQASSPSLHTQRPSTQRLLRPHSLSAVHVAQTGHSSMPPQPSGRRMPQSPGRQAPACVSGTQQAPSWQVAPCGQLVGPQLH